MVKFSAHSISEMLTYSAREAKESGRKNDLHSLMIAGYAQKLSMQTFPTMGQFITELKNIVKAHEVQE